MPISGLTFDPIRAYGKEYVVLGLTLTVGASGAVASVKGKGWAADGTVHQSGFQGSVTKESADGQYSIVLPGRGSVAGILPLQPVIEHATDALFATALAVDLDDRKVTYQLRDDAGAAANATSGAKVHFVLLVKNSNID